MRYYRSLRAALAVAAFGGFAGCSGLTTPGADDNGYTPTWITATWITSTTLVTDRIEREAVGNDDPICLPRFLVIRPQVDRVGFIWTCSQPTWVYGCATEGQPTQSSSGFPTCAQDALETPVSQLRRVYLENDGLQTPVTASGLRSLQLFYCGSETSPSGTPLKCR